MAGGIGFHRMRPIPTSPSGAVGQIEGTKAYKAKFKEIKKSTSGELTRITEYIDSQYKRLLEAHKGDAVKATQELVTTDFPKILAQYVGMQSVIRIDDHLSRIAEEKLSSNIPAINHVKSKVTLASTFAMDRDKYQKIITEISIQPKNLIIKGLKTIGIG